VVGADGSPLGPGNVSVVLQSRVGTSYVDPVMVDNLVYPRYDGEALLVTDYNFRKDRYEDQNLNLDSDQVLRGKVRKLAVTHYPFTIIWVLLEDGTLATLTYDSKREIMAWAEHSITNCTIQNMVSLKAESEKESLFLQVSNYTGVDVISGQTSLQELELENMEYLQDDARVTEKLLDAYIEESDTDTITTSLHLADNTVMAIKDGVNYPQATAVDASGDLTLDASISGDFYVGIPITIRIEQFPVDQPSGSASTNGKIKQVRRIDAQLFRTLSARFQLSSSEYPHDVDFRIAGDDTDSVPPFRNKAYEIPVDGDSDREISLTITQEEQAPFTILGLNYEVDLEGAKK